MTAAIRYVLHQQFRYEYPGPIRDLRHRLVVAPPMVYGDQRRVSHRLSVHPDMTLRWGTDPYGNPAASITAPRIERAVQFDYEAVVERADGAPPPVAPEDFHGQRYRTFSRLTQPSEALRNAARMLLREAHLDRVLGVSSVPADGAEPRPVSLAERINAFVYRHMRYVPGVTNVATTAAEAFATGEGVCQDYAHIMLTLCRLCGIPARYVSGHLLGEGGTHAWLEVIEPDTNGGATHGDTTQRGGTADDGGCRAVAVAFDPTHDRRANRNYVFIAAGRDYADVTPTSGSFDAPYMGVFTTTRRVDVIDPSAITTPIEEAAA